MQSNVRAICNCQWMNKMSVSVSDLPLGRKDKMIVTWSFESIVSLRKHKMFFLAIFVTKLVFAKAQQPFFEFSQHSNLSSKFWEKFSLRSFIMKPILSKLQDLLFLTMIFFHLPIYHRLRYDNIVDLLIRSSHVWFDFYFLRDTEFNFEFLLFCSCLCVRVRCFDDFFRFFFDVFFCFRFTFTFK